MQTLSIITGKYKNQKIEQVEDSRTKYTPSKVKNAVFSILETKKPVYNSSFLDLCAGSGQIGFEALSRGAMFITFVDVSERAIKTLKNNAQKLNCSKDIRIFKKDVIRFIKKPPAAYDIIFIDPPFNEEMFDKVMETLLNHQQLLKPDGRIVVECGGDFKIRESEKYMIEDEHIYSSVKIEILKRKG